MKYKMTFLKYGGKTLDYSSITLIDNDFLYSLVYIRRLRILQKIE